MMMHCEPHLKRGLLVAATATIAGTPMCEACRSGRAVSASELIGELGDDAVRRAQRRYYGRNRDDVLAAHRRCRESRKLAACAAS
jgi:hypothetical protein